MNKLIRENPDENAHDFIFVRKAFIPSTRSVIVRCSVSNVGLTDTTSVPSSLFPTNSAKNAT